MAKEKNSAERYKFFGYLEKQDYLIRGWLHVELWIIVVICLAALFCISHSYAILAWIAVYLFATISMAIISTCRTLPFYRLALSSKEVISKHKDKYLKSLFDKSPRYLLIIIILDALYPITWIFGFVVKLLFSKNAHDMKALLIF